LSKLEATAFPALLDYIYSVGDELEICCETATALHHLGGYFEMRRLRWDAKGFIEMKMSASSCGTFYEHAKILNKQKILDAASNAAALEIMQITIHSRLMHVPDQSFWINIFKNATIDESFSNHVSLLLAIYLQYCGASPETFKKLTARECLCKIVAALPSVDRCRTNYSVAG
jgi:hypothetical protein